MIKSYTFSTFKSTRDVADTSEPNNDFILKTHGCGRILAHRGKQISDMSKQIIDKKGQPLSYSLSATDTDRQLYPLTATVCDKYRESTDTDNLLTQTAGPLTATVSDKDRESTDTNRQSTDTDSRPTHCHCV